MRKGKVPALAAWAAARPLVLFADAVVESSDLCRLGRSKSPIEG